MTEDDYTWLKTLTNDTLNAEEAKVLVYTRVTGAVDNTACREFSGLDTLQASLLLRRLRDRGVLEKQGGGNRTHYILTGTVEVPPSLWDYDAGTLVEKPTKLGEKPTKLSEKPSKLGEKPSKLGEKPSKLDGETFQAQLSQFEKLLGQLSNEIAEQVRRQRGRRLSEQQLRYLLLDLCRERAFTIEELVLLLDKHRKYLMPKHIRPLVSAGKLALRYPESAKHPHQAYITANQGSNERG